MPTVIPSTLLLLYTAIWVYFNAHTPALDSLLTVAAAAATTTTVFFSFFFFNIIKCDRIPVECVQRLSRRHRVSTRLYYYYYFRRRRTVRYKIMRRRRRRHTRTDVIIIHTGSRMCAKIRHRIDTTRSPFGANFYRILLTRRPFFFFFAIPFSCFSSSPSRIRYTRTHNNARVRFWFLWFSRRPLHGGYR